MTVQWSAQKLGRLLHTYLHPTLGADEGSGSLGSLLHSSSRWWANILSDVWKVLITLFLLIFPFKFFCGVFCGISLLYILHSQVVRFSLVHGIMTDCCLCQEKEVAIIVNEAPVSASMLFLCKVQEIFYKSVCIRFSFQGAYPTPFYNWW